MSDNTPILDFKDYGLNIKDPSKVSDDVIKILGKNFINALKTFGFCNVKNHGVEETLIKEYLDVSRAFFEESEDVKEKYRIGQNYGFGWGRLKTEKCDPKSHVADLHEAFNYTPCRGYESWPPIEKFETLTKTVFEMGKKLAFRFCDVLSLGLDQPKEFMRNAHKLIGQNGSSSSVRTLYYPPINADSSFESTQTRIGEHIDFGTLSFIFQDDVGGLEIRDPNGKLIPTEPISDTVLVYTGAMLQRWTAGDLVGTSHRIPIPTDTHRKESIRQSIVWFLLPDDDCQVTCLDGSNKYEPITSRGYFNYRLKEALPHTDPTSKLPFKK